ncbi:MAG TPA: methylmalonyl-CoA mutase family protein [Dehalococcoidales bacterium]|nr:methylmalonyl-CoA mutase family protein [Dehalococcoidales bacterium]
MSRGKTTRQILEEAGEGCGTPLYDSQAIAEMRASLEEWRNTVVPDGDRKNWRTTPRTIIGSGISVGMLYTPLDNPTLVYGRDIGYPGEEPYTRGIHANMYRGKTWTHRQLSGNGSPEYVNRRLKFLLDHGATGINLNFDLATIQMFDSDEEEADGMVATVGVPVDSIDDFEVIYKGIPIDKVSSSLVTHYPRNTAMLFPMYLVMAERRGVPWDTLTGSVQNDFIMESAVRSACEWIPPKDAFRVQCDNIEFIMKEVPRWNSATLNGYNLREFGTSGITEMAVALSNAMLTIDEMLRRGHDVDNTVRRLAFFWSIANNFFEEAARIRAVRRLWYRIMKHKYHARDQRSLWMRCHVQTSGVSLQREEPYNNIVRSAYHALAAVLGGVQSLHIDAYDEAYSVPGEESSLLGLRTQEIIEAETQVTGVVDPLGGSFYVEALTDEIERKIIDEIDEIEKIGGLPEAIEKGWLQQKVHQYILEEQRLIEDGVIKIVARNYYTGPQRMVPQITSQAYDARIRDAMIDKLKTLRRQRDNGKLSRCLDAIIEAGKGDGNITYACLEAVRAGATKGEIRRAFAKAFGAWRPKVVL